jgi:hypothetical protein
VGLSAAAALGILLPSLMVFFALMYTGYIVFHFFLPVRYVLGACWALDLVVVEVVEVVVVLVAILHLSLEKVVMW